MHDGYQGNRSSWPTTQLENISSEPLHHAQPISRWKSSVRDLHARQPSQLSGAQSVPQTSFKLKSDLTSARHQQPAEVYFPTDSRRSLTEAARSPNLPKRLTIQLNTKLNLFSSYGRGYRLLNEALLALSKLKWEESLSQKLKSERGKPSTGSHEVTRICNYCDPLPKVDLHSKLVSIERAKQDEPSATNLAPKNGGNRRKSNGEGFG
ncbi:hypothetical protein F511_26005 [Dorcoceras hygrometricum]|uniref:Uncharacterized protein n=1 Tax=Dorcoceras hygrometricum TaxID=472368 RepID=A0A2Z7DK45_9LAMI|nr:hypothetical protein F511_26005 [Dorcoceras hygrometricum]